MPWLVTHMKQLRQRLEAGQDYRSDDGKIDGVIIKVWPVENGSEALVQLRSTREILQVFIPNEDTPTGH